MRAFFRICVLLSLFVGTISSAKKNSESKGDASLSEAERAWVNETEKTFEEDKDEYKGDIEGLESLATFLDKKFASVSCRGKSKVQPSYFSCFQDVYNQKFLGKNISPRMYKVLYEVGGRAISFDGSESKLDKAEWALRLAEDMGSRSFAKEKDKKFSEKLLSTLVRDVELALEGTEKNLERTPASTSTKDSLRIQTYKERLIRLQN